MNFSTFSLAFIIFITIFDSGRLEFCELELQYNFDLHCSDGDTSFFHIFSLFVLPICEVSAQITGSCMVLIPVPLVFCACIQCQMAAWGSAQQSVSEEVFKFRVSRSSSV